jgi:pimeloyl-ACP methyl ester carboxylesterase
LIAQEKIIIENIGKKPILADVSFLESPQDKPVVIFCHGYKGFKDWGAWNLVASYFAKQGFIFIKFNFSHNGGTIEDPIDFPDEDAFGKNTYSKEIDDLQQVLDYVEREFPNREIYLIGHSRGGGIATLAAAQNSKVDKLVTWAGVSDFKVRFPVGEELEKWRTDGIRYVQNARTKQNLPHYFSFYEDFVQNETKLDIPFWTSKLAIPHLIIHGLKDEAVNLHEAIMLSTWNPDSKTYFLDTNHTFGTKHPWEDKEMSLELKKVSHQTIKFFRGL